MVVCRAVLFWVEDTGSECTGSLIWVQAQLKGSMHVCIHALLDAAHAADCADMVRRSRWHGCCIKRVTLGLWNVIGSAGGAWAACAAQGCGNLVQLQVCKLSRQSVVVEISLDKCVRNTAIRPMHAVRGGYSM